MTLLDRITSIEEDKIKIHPFIAVLAAAKKGSTGFDGTLASRRTEIINRFSLQAGDLSQLDMILTPLAALATDQETSIFLINLAWALMGYEAGFLSVQETASLAGVA